MAQAKPRLLVVTHDVELKGLMDTLMRHGRIQAAVTANVAHAAQFLRSNVLPDVLVLDLTMPDGHLLDFLRQMRERAEYRNLPVLVLTDIPDPDLVRTALQTGANRYLTKLFVAKNLLSTVEEMLLSKPKGTGSKPVTESLRGSL
jgi:twitching motility two-component system response regulator PilH